MKAIVASALFLLATHALASSEGQSIYLKGVDANGRPIKAFINGLESTQPLACVNCHRESGLGSSESGNTIPPVSWDLLQKAQPQASASRYAQLESQRSGYDLASLHRALTTGKNASGKTLGHIMPRYVFTLQQTKSLQEYLKTLYRGDDPGVDENDIYIATIIDSRLPEKIQQQHRQFLQGLVNMKNARTRGELKRKKYAPIQKAPQYQSYKTWKLIEWELPQNPDQWQDELTRMYREQPVFAVLTPVVKDSYEKLADFCRLQKTPCLFGLNTGEFSGDYYNFVFRNEPKQWKDYIAGLQRSQKNKLYFLDDAGNILPLLDRNAQIPVARREAMEKFEQRFPSLCQQDAAVLIKADSRNSEPLMNLACPGEQKLQLKLLRFGGSDYSQIKSLSASQSTAKVCWVNDYTRVLRKNFRKLRVQALIKRFQLEDNERTEDLANVLFAYGVLTDSLHKLNGHFSRAYLLETMEHMLNSYPNFTYYDQVSGAPYQRYIVGSIQEYCPAAGGS